MTISKLTMAASRVVFADLAAWGGAGFAAQGPLAKAPAPQPAVIPAPPLVALASIADTEQTPRNPTAQREKGTTVSEPAIPDDLPPVVLDIVPKVGAVDVDPGLREIRVTFSKKMTDNSWSFTEGKSYAVPKPDGKIHYARDKRMRVMPVKLEAGKTYVLRINSERFRNFKDAEGRPALPYLVVFRTKSP
jgi:Bacterial Ig-like domain